jgi:RND superfamily putative drug exporter
MTLLGKANWWAPAPLRRLHRRFGLHEVPALPAAVGETEMREDMREEDLQPVA